MKLWYLLPFCDISTNKIVNEKNVGCDLILSSQNGLDWIVKVGVKKPNRNVASELAQVITF